MPIVLKIAQHDGKNWSQGKVAHAEALLKGSCEREYRRSQGVIKSSFCQQLFRERHVSPSTNGFVRAVWHAYSQHHHLTLRPEDVWFAILTQLSFHIVANAEELRSFFVAHSGTKHLEVYGGGTIADADFGGMAVQMTELMEKHVLDPDLRAWIMPSFSTTTDSDRVTASILMMGALKKYFSYGMTMICGIPSVTLLGEKEDWEDMLTRLDKIEVLGSQPTLFARLLRPVLRRFIAAFDNPTSQDVLDFWTKCVHQTGGSGPFYLSGWMTAFCFWNEEGKMLYTNPQGPVSLEVFQGRAAGCELDGVFYHRVDTDQIPRGYSTVSVTVNDHGVIHKTTMVAGSVGIIASSNEDRDEENSSNEAALDNIWPLTGWWMYENEDDAAAQEREFEKQKIDERLEKEKSTMDRREMLQLHTRRMELEAY